jgi:ABC-type nitrate/sulfonate/bicarbonate transport system permease component
MNNTKAAHHRRFVVLERVTLALSVPLFIGLWELVSRSGMVNETLFPPPSEVVKAVYEWANSGVLLTDFLMSVSRVLVGFISGAIMGIIVGVLTGRYVLLSNLLTPIFQLLRPIPPIAFVPVVILWFGLTEIGKYFLVFWGVFFTVWISAHIGVQRVERDLIRAAMTLGTPASRMFREVLLPGSLPSILVGLRTSVSISFYTLVAAELGGTFSGLAYRIDIAQQNLQMGQMMGGLVVLGLISYAADKAFDRISRGAVWWK